MLLRISCGAEKLSAGLFQLKCDIPAIYLDSFDYTLCLRQIILDLNDNFSYEPKPIQGHVSLISTAIDKTAINPMQELALIPLDPISNYIFYEPKHLSDYKIQNLAFHSSQFYLQFTTADVFVNSVDILLEIDAGIQ